MADQEGGVPAPSPLQTNNHKHKTKLGNNSSKWCI